MDSRQWPSFTGKVNTKRFFPDLDAAEMVKIAGANMTFRLTDAVEPVIHESWLQHHVSQGLGSDEDEDASSTVQTGVCLVTGKREEIARLHPKVYGVCSKPSPLAAANSKEAPAYASYGKEQGFIFPIGKPAAFSYATALNHLLQKISTHIRMGGLVHCVLVRKRIGVLNRLSLIFLVITQR